MYIYEKPFVQEETTDLLISFICVCVQGYLAHPLKLKGNVNKRLYQPHKNLMLLQYKATMELFTRTGSSRKPPPEAFHIKDKSNDYLHGYF